MCILNIGNISLMRMRKGIIKFIIKEKVHVNIYYSKIESFQLKIESQQKKIFTTKQSLKNLSKRHF